MGNLLLGALITAVLFGMWRTFAGIPDTYIARAMFGSLQGMIAVVLIGFAILHNRRN